ncbi:hypothetical protein [Streptomyces sp. NPDC005244]|uniref:hypothetical protein n=1 Tax=Streptomyces sp. NPDC005244 TaxID=3364708 RepID=UPI0036B1DEF2
MHQQSPFRLLKGRTREPVFVTRRGGPLRVADRSVVLADDPGGDAAGDQNM